MAFPSKKAILPYKLFIIILYGRFKWVNRDALGVTRLPIARLTTVLRTDSTKIRAALEALDDWGLLTRWKHWGHYVEVVAEVPQGMLIKLPAIETIEASIEDPEILELLSEQER